MKKQELIYSIHREFIWIVKSGKSIGHFCQFLISIIERSQKTSAGVLAGWGVSDMKMKIYLKKSKYFKRKLILT